MEEEPGLIFDILAWIIIIGVPILAIWLLRKIYKGIRNFFRSINEEAKKIEAEKAKKAAPQSNDLNAFLDSLTPKLVSGNEDKESMFCRIAGANYRCTTKDIGGFLGFVVPEPSNPHDPNALAILTLDKKHVGYIPRDDQEEYREFAQGAEVCPCIGFISEGASAFYGKVKIFRPDDPTRGLQALRFAQWMVRQFGKSYMPKSGFEISGNPKTKQAILDALDEAIEQEQRSLEASEQ